jgi:hypothetical protein
MSEFDRQPNMGPAGTPPPSGAPAPVKFEDIHVMPDRFLSSESRKSGGKGSKNLVIILILAGVLVIGGGAAAAAYFFLKPAANENANNAQVLNVNTANLNQAVNTTTNTNNSNANTSNSNSGLNANTANRNTNSTNLNLNSNANTNTNGNSNTNATNTNSGVARTEPLPSTTDTDDDGLTDAEERLYGTNASQPDSDGDSFIDGKQFVSMDSAGREVFAGEFYLGYNPLGVGRLDTSGLVRSFTNSTFSYAILYPSQWLAQAAKSDNRSILFTPAEPTGETIQVIILDNPTKLTARNYYLADNPGVNAASIETVVVNGLEGIRTANQEDVYLAKGDKVYQIHYAVGQLTSLNFMISFEMMYQNFRLTST